MTMNKPTRKLPYKPRIVSSSQVMRRANLNKDDLICSAMLADQSEHTLWLPLARELDVKPSCAQAKESRQQAGVVDVGAVRGIAVATRTGVYTDPAPLVVGEATENRVVQRDELVQ